MKARTFTLALTTDKNNNPITDDFIDDLLIKYKGVYTIYCIKHDKDDTKNIHFHFLLWTKNPRDTKTIANMFNTTENFIQVVYNKNAMLRYLTHLDNPDKEKYNPEDVLTNDKPYKDIILNQDITDKEIYQDILTNGEASILKYIGIVDTHRLSTIQRLLGNQYMYELKKEVNEVYNRIDIVVSYLEKFSYEYRNVVATLREQVPQLADTMNKNFVLIASSIRQLRGVK